MTFHDDTGFYWERVPDPHRRIWILMVGEIVFIHSRQVHYSDPHDQMFEIEVVIGGDRVLVVRETLPFKTLWKYTLELLGEL